MTISLDIATFVTTATFVVAFFGLYAFWRGRVAIRESGELPYHRLRQQRLVYGWQVIVWGLVLFGVSAWLYFYGRPVAFSIFPVTPTPLATATPSLFPTPSLTPSITPIPSETPTLQFSLTPSPTAVPTLPQAIATEFTSQVTPNPNAAFSPLAFARGIDFRTFQGIGLAESFANPLVGIYAIFSYDGMLPGVQWTAVWVHEGGIVHYETKPWDGTTGGYGFTEWIPDAEDWLPGNYQVHIFVGTEAKVSGAFDVSGAPATSSPTPTATSTKTATPTATATHTRFPTATKEP
ncbi:MAG: hypothetical protein WD751_05680 [Anaerolineales bacterium]